MNDKNLRNAYRLRAGAIKLVTVEMAKNVAAM